MADSDTPGQRPNSLLDESRMGSNDIDALRKAMMEREGLLADVFELLRTVPKCVTFIIDYLSTILQ